MVDAVQILWSAAGETMPSLGARALVDLSDGDTPNIRMPIRMLSVDTPETTAGSQQRAGVIDQDFAQLAEWMRQGKAPISAPLAEFLVPKLATGNAGTLQLQQGKAASAFAEQNTEVRLTRPNGSKRNLFLRTADTPFDNYHRLLAYVAPNYSAKEREELPREQRTTFNLDLVAHGWAAPFVIYPSVPGALDLPLLIEAAAQARSQRLGCWADDATLLAYEYRAMEKLYRLTKKKVEEEGLRPGESYGWRQRYCVDMRSRVLFGPEDYFGIDPEYRLWLWPSDLNDAIGRLNLTPAPQLVTAGAGHW
jgi:endonuclease YncB( thermonuclease family)